MNKKPLSDQVDVGRPAKVYLTDKLWEIVSELLDGKSISRFFRELIPLAWSARKGDVLMVPVAGAQPGYVYTAMVDENGRKVAAKLADNLVAVPHAEFSRWQETNRFFHQAVAMNRALTDKLREKDDLIESMLGVKTELINQRKYCLDIGDYPCKPSLEESKEEARQFLRLLEWSKQAAAIRERYENCQ